jgi:hypothetical protein
LTGLGHVIFQIACEFPQLRVLGVDKQASIVDVINSMLRDWKAEMPIEYYVSPNRVMAQRVLHLPQPPSVLAF